jgi:hypothetical protein
MTSHANDRMYLRMLHILNSVETASCETDFIVSCAATNCQQLESAIGISKGQVKETWRSRMLLLKSQRTSRVAHCCSLEAQVRCFDSSRSDQQLDLQRQCAFHRGHRLETAGAPDRSWEEGRPQGKSTYGQIPWATMVLALHSC